MSLSDKAWADWVNRHRPQHDTNGTGPTPEPKQPPTEHYADAIITAWDGRNFIPLETWYTKYGCGKIDPNFVPTPPSKQSLTGVCDQEIQVYLIRRPTRWQIYARKPGKRFWKRRKDFATISQDHCRKCAELWYGVPANGWHPFTGKLPQKKRKETTPNADQ
jgi:hypothetical protein